jgi:choline dehydrogenase
VRLHRLRIGLLGSVAAGRLAENLKVKVLLLEASGDDYVAGVMRPERRIFNLATDRVWN